MPGTEWDSSEKGQLRPGLSESIACLPSVATHGGARPHRLRALLPAGTNRVTPEETNVREKEIPGRTSLVRALALHGVLRPPRSNRNTAASHLASPLRPGRGVLIRSVSRRLGSVAYVREDASPNEVSRFSTEPSMPWGKAECQFRADRRVTVL